MKQILIPCLALGLLAALPLHAQTDAPKPDWSLSGNAGLSSDYRFRGFTQTGYKPSFQGGFDLAHRSGFYFGNANANVEQSLYRGASLEMDVYGGYKFQAAGLGVDLGAITCRYPTRANTGSLGEVHHEEVYLGLSYAFLSAKFSYGLSNYFGLGDGTPVDTKGNWYLDLGAARDLGGGWGVSAHYGRQSIRNAEAPAIGLRGRSVDDYKVGLTKDLNGWALSASWTGTSRKGFFTTGVSAPEAGGRGALVLGLSKSF
ncbi:MAG: hypothetical protein HY014_02850 [Acidobacteria bacterium]|nr:hypothetical protein [Acidobacteriota bacterium]MBI3487089.1 hypothetical protein [Acidobacteriota bacterium]